jgi:hypothetical protein
MSDVRKKQNKSNQKTNTGENEDKLTYNKKQIMIQIERKNKKSLVKKYKNKYQIPGLYRKNVV